MSSVATSMNSAKSSSVKNSRRSPNGKGNGKDGKGKDGIGKKEKPLHKQLVSMMSRPNGATVHDTWNAGYYFPAMAAVKLVERRGYKVQKIKKEGELTRYVAKRAAKRSNSASR